jgi:hypothetical protein
VVSGVAGVRADARRGEAAGRSARG